MATHAQKPHHTVQQHSVYAHNAGQTSGLLALGSPITTTGPGDRPAQIAANTAYTAPAAGMHIIAGANDTLTGAAGINEYVLAAGLGTVKITNFDSAGTDIVDLRHSGLMGLTFAEIQADTTVTGTTATIALGNGTTIQLDGIADASALTAANFELPGTGSHHGGHHDDGGNPPPLPPAPPLAPIAANTAYTAPEAGMHILAGANDTLTGAAGVNEYVVGANLGTVEITNFDSAGTDIVDLRHSGVAATTFAALQADISVSGNNTLLALGNGTTLQLDGTSAPLTLTAANFELPGQGGEGKHGGHQFSQVVIGFGSTNVLTGAASGNTLFSLHGEHSAPGNTEITNFVATGSNADAVKLDGFGEHGAVFASLNITENAAGTAAVLTLANGSTVTFDGLLASALSAADFIMH